MCGIAGFIDNSLNRDDAGKIISGMLESISHRGPDARDTWIELPVILGHNRLSIIDLSEDGNQPMHYHDAAIIFNGEMYNYIEVREELKEKGYEFKTQSDTEVILSAYREWGTSCVNKFLGMWAFALWDKKKKILFCSRDRFGIKPFYYIHEGQKFYFGSEYKALKKSPVFSNDLNLDQVSRGLQLGWVCYNDETYYTKLKSLPAACNLIYEEGKVRVERYWDLDETQENTLRTETPAKIKESLRELLFNSVDIHMRSDVEIAICLSGGIDSSSLTGIISKLFPSEKFNSYSIYYDGKGEVDERPFINEVIKKYPNINSNLFKPSPDEILERFHDIMYKVDVPSTGSSNFSHYYLLEQIKKDKVKVVVDGQGADEYLGGYMHSMYRYNAELISTFQIGKLISNISRTYSYQKQSVNELIGTVGKSALSMICNEMSLYKFEYKNYYPQTVINNGHIPFSLENKFKGTLNNFLYHLLFTTSLPTILHYVDRMTMAHSVESRVPLLDHRLVEFAFKLTNNYKIMDGVTKKILRDTLIDILPEKIYQRKDKKGFVTPGENNWLRGPMKHFLDIDFNALYFLDKSKTKIILKKYLMGDNSNSKLVWRLSTLNYWIKNIN